MAQETPQPPRARRRGAAGARPAAGGKLRIGDDWNAISIIALSQDNPLKAVAEFVENSIDAGAASRANSASGCSPSGRWARSWR